MAWFDHRWSGTDAAIAAAIKGHRNVLGPKKSGGLTYAAVRSNVPLALPPGCQNVGVGASADVLGVWGGEECPMTATDKLGLPILVNPLAYLLGDLTWKILKD